MDTRRAACEPCRKAKVACGHERPVCARCKKHKADSCVYRAAPFKRRRSPSPDLLPRPFSPSTPRRTYANPGYLGPSSHVSIFSDVLPEENSTRDFMTPAPSVSVSLNDHPSSKEGAALTRQLLSSFELSALRNLVTFWRARGANLAVAEPFVDVSLDINNYATLSQGHLNFATHLLQNTSQPLEYNLETTLASYSSQFSGTNTRWETFGIFLCAVIGATRDVLFFPPLYTTSSQNLELRHLLTRLVDRALDISLSVDCLNDLQLVLQYETFIVHSYVDGDQSYRYWRILGDVIASISALGYHENIETKPQAPRFLTELRKTIFAGTYSADKNVSIFLGRPLRMSKRFCYFQVPFCRLRNDHLSVADEQSSTGMWGADASLSYAAEICWSALCASVKEEILELLFDRRRVNLHECVDGLQTTADNLWNSLPPHFHFEGPLIQLNNSPFERDLLISLRLNYLHISFLLRRLTLPLLAEPDGATIIIAQEMLHLVLDAILLRDELANSGTGLDWKIAYYGLPAAGVLLVALLRQHKDPSCPRVARGKVLEDLTVLAAEVDRGTVVRRDEPNFAVLSKATQTIRRLLNHINSDESFGVATEVPAQVQPTNDWLTQSGHDPYDFDVDFWQGLDDHSSLFNLDLPTDT